MLIHTIGTQNIAVPAGGTPLDVNVVSDATKETRTLYRVNLPSGFALTGGGTWDTLVAAAAIPSAVTEIEIFMAGSDDVEIGRGAVASETSITRIQPGGNGRIPVDIAAGERVALRTPGAGLTTGELIINFYGP